MSSLVRVLSAALALAAPYAGQSILLPSGQPDPAYPGFHAWYDAADGVNGTGAPADGVALTSWEDRTGNGHHLVRTDASPLRQPTFEAAVLSGQPAVRFDGDDYVWGDSTGEFGTLQGAKTFFVVARADLADGGYLFDSSSSQGRNAVFTGQTSAPAKWTVFAGANPVSVGPDVKTGLFRVHSIVFRDAANEHFLDGVAASGGGAPTADQFGLILGSRYTVNHGLTGYIAEVLVYDEVLAVADRAMVEGYLLARYGLPIGLTASTEEVSLASGGTQFLELTAGPPFGGLSYLLLGSASGTSPGFPVDAVVLPLNVDSYTLATLLSPNTPPLASSLGILDPTGAGSASVVVPTGLSASLAGTTLHHAYVVIELLPTLLSAVYASNAVPLVFVP